MFQEKFDKICSVQMIRAVFVQEFLSSASVHKEVIRLIATNHEAPFRFATSYKSTQPIQNKIDRYLLQSSLTTTKFLH